MFKSWIIFTFAKGSLLSKDTIEITRQSAILFLEDGTVFSGIGFGTSKKAGEDASNTSMVDYAEAITAPSYGNKIFTQTYFLAGNCGISSPASCVRYYYA